MKILAIRGENLASLAGPFEVTLDQPPLSDLGLVPISGPTGAGKTTLLDAICLALFDRTPRLKGRGGSRVGYTLEHDRDLLSADPRCLLRRGAAEGFAEVDFVGLGARRYRARWSVRRARGKPDGRLQAQSLSLEDLDSGQALGGSTKTSVLQATEEAVGLDYDAFCRSVLLAQGEFAAFLEAPPTERAELLERLTGTELYGELSKAAHRKASEARRALERLEDQLGAIHALSPEQRATISAQLAEAEAAVDEAKARLQRAEAAERWHTHLAGLRRQVEQAEAERVAAGEAWRATVDLRDELHAVEAAQAHRPAWDAARAATHELATASAEHATRLASAAAAQRARREASAQVEQAGLRLADAQAAQQAAAPELAEARRLDAASTAAQASAASARALATRHAQAAAEADATVQRLRRASVELEAQRDAAQTWLRAHEHLVAVSNQWPRWQDELNGLAETRIDLDALRAGRPPLEAARDQAVEAAQASEVALRRASAGLVDARQVLEAARPADEDDWRAAHEGVHAARLTLSGLESLRVQATKAQTTRDEAARLARAADAEATLLRAAVHGVRQRLPVAEAGLHEAQRALRATQTARDLEAQRHTLRPGEPCPLCGAAEHPYAAELPPLSRLESEQAARVETLQAERDALRERETQHTQALAERERAEQDAARAAATADAELETLRRDWAVQAEPAGWGLPADPADPEAEAALAARRDQLDRTLTALTTQAEALAVARAALEHAQGEHERLAAEARAAEQARDNASTALATHDALLAQAQERRSRHLHALVPIFPVPRATQVGLFDAAPSTDGTDPRADWRRRAEQDPIGLLEALSLAIDGWTTRSAEWEALEQRLVEARSQAGAAEARADERSASAQASALEAARLEADAAELARARQAVLGGSAADEAEAILLTALETARAAHAAARTLQASTEATLAAADANVASAVARLAQAHQVLSDAESALATRLEAAALSRERLGELLDRDPAWLPQTRDQLRALEQRRLEATKALEIHSQQRAAHEGQDPPQLSAVEAPPARVEAQAALAVADTARIEAQSALAADDRAQTEAATLAPQREAAHARAELQQGLNELIGSHDGKKLRVFAQSLSLELLLEQANLHLRALSPRYLLQRVGQRDLDLEVVDHDLGDEVRAISGLSGGERFLVSLALALALASLAARDTAVESLFVDEGLGSLDPESQELALASLDALQAGGRQVVLISHVPGIAERAGAGVRVVPRARGASVVETGALDPSLAPIG